MAQEERANYAVAIIGLVEANTCASVTYTQLNHSLTKTLAHGLLSLTHRTTSERSVKTQNRLYTVWEAWAISIIILNWTALQNSIVTVLQIRILVQSHLNNSMLEGIHFFDLSKFWLTKVYNETRLFNKPSL